MRKLVWVVLPILMLLGAPVWAQLGGYISYGQTVGGDLYPGQFHYWDFQGSAGDTIEVSLISDTFDTYLIVSDGAGNVLCIDDDSGAGTNSYMTSCQLRYHGQYVLQVSSASNAGGRYSLSLAHVQSAVREQRMYTNNFDYYVGGYPEWGYAQLSSTPSGRNFLGPFSRGPVVFSLGNLPPHTSVVVEWDLGIMQTWDGNQTHNNVGPDIFDVRITGSSVPILRASFSNSRDGQSYPDPFGGPEHPPWTAATEIGSLGYGAAGDSVYHIYREFAHTDPWLSLTFTGPGNEPESNESWGIDNFSITVKNETYPEPLHFCTQNQPNYMRVGMIAELQIRRSLRAWPRDDAVKFYPLDAGSIVKVIDGPECVNGSTWWLVSIDSLGVVGWVQEYNYDGYQLLMRVPGRELEPVNWLQLSDSIPQLESVVRELNVRDAPSVESGAKLVKIGKGQSYNVYGRTYNGIWYWIRLTDNNGRLVDGWVCGYPLTRRNFDNSQVQPMYNFPTDVTNYSRGDLIPNEDCSGDPYP